VPTDSGTALIKKNAQISHSHLCRALMGAHRLADSIAAREAHMERNNIAMGGGGGIGG